MKEMEMYFLAWLLYSRTKVNILPKPYQKRFVKRSTRQNVNLFRVDENRIERCCAAYIVQCFQQYRTILLNNVGSTTLSILDVNALLYSGVYDIKVLL